MMTGIFIKHLPAAIAYCIISFEYRNEVACNAKSVKRRKLDLALQSS